MYADWDGALRKLDTSSEWDGGAPKKGDTSAEVAPPSASWASSSRGPAGSVRSGSRFKEESSMPLASSASSPAGSVRSGYKSRKSPMSCSIFTYRVLSRFKTFEDNHQTTSGLEKDCWRGLTSPQTPRSGMGLWEASVGGVRGHLGQHRQCKHRLCQI